MKNNNQIYNLFDKEIPVNIIDALKGIKAESTSWTWHYAHNVKASGGNIQQLTDDIFCFVEHNYLPRDGRTLDGHYKFFINVKTFDFLVTQNGYYGGLTYTTPPRETGWTNLNEKDIEYVKAVLAHKLRGMYFYEWGACNQQGRNFFGNGKFEKGGEHDRYKKYYRDGPKTSLICDYREYPDERESLGYIDPIEKKAIKLLQNEY